MENLIDIELLQVKDAHPDKFWARECQGGNMSREAQAFQRLETRIRDYYESEHTPHAPVNCPANGKIYIGRVGRMLEERKWRRVQVVNVMQSKDLKNTICFLLDYACTENVSSRWLREAPAEFLEAAAPYQAKKFALHYLIPQTLAIDMESMCSRYEPSYKWDPSALKFFSKRLRECTHARACLLAEQDGVTYVRLYLTLATGEECINEMLLNRRFAVRGDREALWKKAEELRREAEMVSSDERNYQDPSLQAAIASSLTPPISVLESRNLKKNRHVDHDTHDSSGNSKKRQPSSDEDMYADMPALEANPPSFMRTNHAKKKHVGGYSKSQTEENAVNRVSSGDEFSEIPSEYVTGSLIQQPVKYTDAKQSKPVSSGIGFHKEVHEKDQDFSSVPVIPLPDSFLDLPGKGRGSRLLQTLKIVPQRSPSQSSCESTQSGVGRGQAFFQKSVDNKGDSLELSAKHGVKPLSKPEFQGGGDGFNCLPSTASQHSSEADVSRIGPKSNQSQSNHIIPGRTIASIGRGMPKIIPPTHKPSSEENPAVDSQVLSLNTCMPRPAVSTLLQPTAGRGIVKVSPCAQQKSSVENARSTPDAHLSGLQAKVSSPQSLAPIGRGGMLKIVPTPQSSSVENSVLDSPRSSPQPNLQNQHKKVVKGRGSIFQIVTSPQTSSWDDSGGNSPVRSRANIQTASSVDTSDVNQPRTSMKELPSKGLGRGILMKKIIDGQFSDDKSEAEGDESTRLQPILKSPANAKKPTQDSDDEPNTSRRSVTFSDADDILEIPGRSVQLQPKQPAFSDSSDSPRICSKIDILPRVGRSSLYKPMVDESLTPQNQKVLYYGPQIPPATRIDELPFAELMKKALLPKEHITATKLQMFVWPAIIRGRHTVGVAASGAGKTTAYLVPIMRQLETHLEYKDLPRSCGPIMCILCPTWQRGKDVYQKCVTLAKLLRERIRPLLMYGGEREEAKEIDLLNGCEVLISTPHCLLRMLEQEKTKFDRLCHLVLDDADRLTEDFTMQISAIMRIRALALSKLRQLAVPQQLLMFSSRWTLGMTSFARKFMEEPAMAVTSLAESAIFGKVRQKCIICGKDQRRRTVLELVDPSLTYGHKIIVFVRNAEDGELLKEYLEISSRYVLLVHQEMEDIVMREQLRSWKAPHRPDSNPVLITTDNTIPELEITDATYVIHYDPPARRQESTGRGSSQKEKLTWMMGHRLWTMSSNFVNLVENAKLHSRCMSHILVCEGMESNALQYLKLLERSYASVPAELNAMVQKHLAQQDRHKAKPLCTKLKMFGHCRNEVRCVFRHTVVPKFDAPGKDPKRITIPTEGHVKVLITGIQEATCFVGRLLQVKDKDGCIRKWDDTFMSLTLDMNLHYAQPQNKKNFEILVKEELYAYEDIQHTFHRCLVKQFTAPNAQGVIEKAQIHLLDRGYDEVVSTEQLYILPDEFRDIPQQSVEIIACRVQPLDNDDLMTQHAEVFISKLIHNKELEGKIVLSVGATLWLDPLEHRTKLTAMNKVITNFSVRAELIKERYAEANGQHLHRLYSLCEGRLLLPEQCQKINHATKAYTAYGMPIEPEVNTLEDCGRHVEVYVSAVANPNLMYVQLGEMADSFALLQEDLSKHVEMSEPEPLTDVRSGMLVLAQFPDTNKQWCRCKVIEVKDDEADLFFVDTGEQEWVQSDSLRPIHNVFLRLPFQAIECGLSHVEPKGEDWSDSEGDVVWQYTRTEADNPVRLIVQVVSCDQGAATGMYRYGVELCNTSKPYDIDLAQLLVARGLAKLSSTKLEDLFPMDSTSQVNYSYKSIPTLCRTLFNIEDESTKAQISTQIMQRVEENKHVVEEMVQNGIVDCVVNLIRYEQDKRVLEPATRALVVMATSSNSAREMLRQCGCIGLACQLLDDETCGSVHSSMMNLLKPLLVNTTCCEWLRRTSGLKLMCHMLVNHPSSQTQCVAAENLTAILKDVHEKCDLGLVRNSGCLSTLAEVVEKGVNMAVLHQCLCALHSLSAYTALRDAIRSSGGVKAICSRLAASLGMNRTNQGPAFKSLTEVAIKTLRALANNNRYNKEVMNDCNMIEIFQNLSKCGLSPDVGEICEEMQQRLISILPSQKQIRPNSQQSSSTPKKQVILNRPLINDGKVHQRAFPEVQWSQSRWNILLCVQVKGVKPNTRPAQVMPHTVSFSAVTDGTEYRFTFPLYEVICPDKCELLILASEVRLGLRKATKGRWPSLLKAKEKRSYIKVDYSRFVDSSSDSDESDDEQKSPLKLAKRNISRDIPMSDPTVRARTVLLDDDDDDDDDNDEPLDSDLDEDFDRFDPTNRNMDYHVI